MTTDGEYRALAERLAGNPKAHTWQIYRDAAEAILALLEERDTWERRADALLDTTTTGKVLLTQEQERIDVEARASVAESRLAKAMEALREIDGNLTNLQPKLVNGPMALDKDRLVMVDRYVGPAIAAARSALSELEQPNG